MFQRHVIYLLFKSQEFFNINLINLNIYLDNQFYSGFYTQPFLLNKIIS